MTAKNTILAMDTATGPCSVALWHEGHRAAYVENQEHTRQSTSLMPMIEQVLHECDVSYTDLSAVACTVGPGSFTGIRVGLAAASGICFAAETKGLGFTTLSVLAYAAAQESPDADILAILNAGKGEVYYQGFNKTSLFEPRVGKIEEAIASRPDAIICGKAPDAVGSPFPRADALATLAAHHFSDALPLTPYYIREPDAKPMAEQKAKK